MAIVAGVDFGTLSVRVSWSIASAGCWIRRLLNIRCIASVKIQSYATQAHEDHMRALAAAPAKP